MKDNVTEPKETERNCTNDTVTIASGDESKEMSMVRSPFYRNICTSSNSLLFRTKNT